MQTMLFMEFWSAAMRDAGIREQFARRHSDIRGAISSLVTVMRTTYGVETALPDLAIGPIITALADGFALQRLRPHRRPRRPVHHGAACNPSTGRRINAWIT